MRDKVPLMGNTGTGKGDVVRKGDSARREHRTDGRVGVLRATYSPKREIMTRPNRSARDNFVRAGIPVALAIILSSLVPLNRAVAVNAAVIPNPVVADGRITQFHGQYPVKPKERVATHMGLDIGAPVQGTSCTGKETAVHAFADGTVDDVALTPGYMGATGNAVRLKHTAQSETPEGRAFYTTYLHLASAPQDADGKALTKGDKIARGQLIGYMGNTQAPGGCHVHFEVKLQPEWAGRWRTDSGVVEENIYGLGDVRLGSYRENWENFAANWIDPVMLFCRYPNGMNEGDPLAGDCESLRMKQYPAGVPLAMMVKGDEVVTNDDVNVRVMAMGDGRLDDTLIVSGIQTKGIRGVVVGGPDYQRVGTGTYWWWQIDFDSGPDGWVAEQFLNSGLKFAGGCQCVFLSGEAFDSWPNPPLFESFQTCRVKMNLDGKAVELRAKGRFIDSQTGLGDSDCRGYPEYVGEGYDVQVELEETGRCPPDSAECEVTGYLATFTVEKDGKSTVYTGSGGCGC
jgi:murein DD-endopeptidase MepM/ murein hydrolase activator NlpD